jgi:hypothetical protein
VAALGTVVAFKYRPEGVGTGKPESTCNVLVQGYKESSWRRRHDQVEG